MLYRVKNWGLIYENNRSREIKAASWIAFPNRHDDDTYLAIVDRANGATMFGAFAAILMVASKSNPRGVLMRSNGTPHDAASIARMTRLKQEIISEALELFVGLEVLEIVAPQDGAASPQDGAASPQDGAASPQDGAASPHNVAPNERTNGTGQDGTEANGTNEDRSSARSVEKSGPREVTLKLVDKRPPYDAAKALEEDCMRILGKDEMTRCGSRWRKRIADEPDKLRRVLADIETAIKEGTNVRKLGAYAEDLWGRFK